MTLLGSERIEVRRAAMLIHASKRDECSAWSALHYGARSGSLAFVCVGIFFAVTSRPRFLPSVCACRDWGLIGEQCSEVDLNQQSKDGSTPLHLAAWNGQAAVISSVLAPWPNGVANLLAASVCLNVALAPLSGPSPAASSSAYSELDLAVKKQHLHTARLLIRYDGTTCELSGHKGADELLHRCVLLGDGITAEKMFRNDAFRVQVRRGCKGFLAHLLRSPLWRHVQAAPSLMTLLARLKYADTCTFTVAQQHNPIDQFMYECINCGQTVCLVCRDLCHPHCAWEVPPGEPPSVPVIRATVAAASEAASPIGFSSRVEAPSTPISRRRKKHVIRPLGHVSETYCCCDKTSCRAIGAINPREAAGFTWVPSPIDTRSVSINVEAGSELGMLVDRLAWNSHEVRWRSRTSVACALNIHLFHCPRCGREIASPLDGSGVQNVTIARNFTRPC